MLKLELTFRVTLGIIELISSYFYLSFLLFFGLLLFVTKTRKISKNNKEKEAIKHSWQIRLIISILLFSIYILILAIYHRPKQIHHQFDELILDSPKLFFKVSTIIVILIQFYLVWFAMKSTKIIKKNIGTLYEEFSHIAYKPIPKGYSIYMCFFVLFLYNFLINLLSYHERSVLLPDRPTGREFAVKFEWFSLLVFEIIASYCFYRMYKKYYSKFPNINGDNEII